LVAGEPLPAEVEQAMSIDWGVVVDAYLCSAARVGDVYAAKAYGDRSSTIENGMTVVTPPTRSIHTVGSFSLLQSQSGADHYVLVSEYVGED